DMSGDSAEFMIEMIDMFKQQTPIYMADLEQAVRDEDWTKASGFAHKIKPTFVYVGREDAKDHMQMIEHCARDLKDVNQIPTLFNEVNEFVQLLYKQLDQARAELEKRL
ncbi:histidine phosphotransferase, partial [Pedobacter sp. HMWF019]|uniref:Hpt domain-containing protein n=1 Tax=Pedobacter sp. HMWF019 TaxID=2056856 RepID=UPI000D383187